MLLNVLMDSVGTFMPGLFIILIPIFPPQAYLVEMRSDHSTPLIITFTKKVMSWPPMVTLPFTRMMHANY